MNTASQKQQDTKLLPIAAADVNRLSQFLRWLTDSPVNCSKSVFKHPTEPLICRHYTTKGKGSPYSTAERRVSELIPVIGSQPAGDVSHKLGGRLPLLSTRPAVTLATLKRAATNFAGW